jgi:hypothetical protein
MSTSTRKRLLAMAGVTAGMATAVVAPSPAHAATAPEAGPSASELQNGVDPFQATGTGTATLGTCWSWYNYPLANYYVLRFPSLAEGGSVDCDLRMGDVTHGVYKLQDALNFCYGQELDRDGNFGIATHRAVKNVQAFHEQPLTGVYSASLGSVMRWPIFNRSSGQWTRGCYPY